MTYKPLEEFKPKERESDLSIFEQAERIHSILRSCPRDLIPRAKRRTPEAIELVKEIKKKLKPYSERLVQLIPKMLESIESSLDTEQLDLKISNVSDLLELMTDLEGYTCDMKTAEDWTRREEIVSMFRPLRARIVDLIPKLFDELERSLEIDT